VPCGPRSTAPTRSCSSPATERRSTSCTTTTTWCAATNAGIGHVVALSGLDADTTSPFCYAVTYGHTEQLLRDSGCAVSIARTSIFTEFFLRFLHTARQQGQIRLPAGDGSISMVSIADVGRCLAALALAPPTGTSA